MKIKSVPRSEIRVTKKSSSKYKPLMEALQQLLPQKDAIEVSYTTEKEMNSMRNVVYTFSRNSGHKIKSGKDIDSKKIYFFRDK